MAIRWQFVETARARYVSWTWRVLLADGTTSSSTQSFETYGVAIHDAIRHGFLPSEHEWSVISGTGIAQFQCGHDPVMTAGGTGQLRFERRKTVRRRPGEPRRQLQTPPTRPAAGKRPPGK
jgi:hypothetical protein